METRNENTLVSHISIHPGKILADWLEEIGIKGKDFAASIGIPASRLSEVIRGRKPITEEFAQRLVKPLGMDAAYWLRLQANFEYNEKMLALRGQEEVLAEAKEENISKIFNIKELYKYLHISAVNAIDRVKILVDTLQISYEDLMTPSVIAGCFKHSDTLSVDENNLRTWVLIAQYQAKKNIPQTAYLGNARQAAEEIAQLAKNSITESQIIDILTKHGISYAIVEKLKQCPIDAYSVMLNTTPAIVVTHRHNDMQKLIFDILHELGHIALHMNEEYREFINVEYSHENPQEKQADEFARDMLIPPALWANIMKLNIHSANPNIICRHIGDRAVKMGVNPRIAVARYKHEYKNYVGSEYRSTRIV